MPSFSNLSASATVHACRRSHSTGGVPGIQTTSLPREPVLLRQIHEVLKIYHRIYAVPHQISEVHEYISNVLRIVGLH